MFMQWLAELYHRKTTMMLNDEESNLAVYIFDSQYNKKADELIILFYFILIFLIIIIFLNIILFYKLYR